VENVDGFGRTGTTDFGWSDASGNSQKGKWNMRIITVVMKLLMDKRLAEKRFVETDKQ